MVGNTTIAVITGILTPINLFILSKVWSIERRLSKIEGKICLLLKGGNHED